MAAVFNKPFLPGYRLVNGGQLNDLFNNAQWSTENGIIAHAGGTKAAAYPLTAQLNVVATVATAADSLLLPPAIVGRIVTVVNNGAAAAQVFGQGTDTINGVATGTGISQVAGSTVTYICAVLGAWQAYVGVVGSTTAATFSNTGLKIQDTAADNTTTIKQNSNEAADRILNIPALGADDTVMTLGTAQTVAAVKTFSAMPIIPSATVAAAGTVQGDAAQIATGFTLATGADGTKGVLLPAAAAGLVCIVKNRDSDNAVLKIWPTSGDGVNAVAVNSAFSIAAKTSVMLVAFDATTWYSVPLLPS